MGGLPPPSRVYTPLRIEAKIGGGSDESTLLLRAVRLSQTRAQEAEEKAWHASKENEAAAALLFDEFLRSSAHRRWMKQLEVELSMIQGKIMQISEEEEEEQREDKGMPAIGWHLAFALCLGVVGVGFGFLG